MSEFGTENTAKAERKFIKKTIPANTQEQAALIKELRSENNELKRTNEIIIIYPLFN